MYAAPVSVDGLVELSIHVAVKVCHRPVDINISISSGSLPHNLALAMTGSALYTSWLVVVHLAGQVGVQGTVNAVLESPDGLPGPGWLLRGQREQGLVVAGTVHNTVQNTVHQGYRLGRDTDRLFMLFMPLPSPLPVVLAPAHVPRPNS